MNKIIAKEVSPESVDFSNYFDDDGLKSVSGENCAVYIPGDRHSRGFNYDEYKEIQEQAEEISNGFNDISNKQANDYISYSSYKEVMESNGVTYNSHKCHDLKRWAYYADISDTDSIAEYLTITTGEEWKARAFCGYSQGDYCELIYCVKHYKPKHIEEIGKMWLGCGTEFSIDDCYGYFVIDDIRWTEDERLVNLLAEYAGCKPEELEVYLYKGEHKVSDYELLAV